MILVVNKVSSLLFDAITFIIIRSVTIISIIMKQCFLVSQKVKQLYLYQYETMFLSISESKAFFHCFHDIV